VLVKRPTADLLARLHRAHTPIVWDVVDAFPQPIGNLWSRSECMAWLQQMMSDIKPTAVVAATSAMAADLVSFGVPVLSLPHHARPAQEVNPIRTDVRVVGYEGSVEHLGGWRQRLEIECARRGLRFVDQPGAARGARHRRRHARDHRLRAAAVEIEREAGERDGQRHAGDLQPRGRLPRNAERRRALGRHAARAARRARRPGAGGAPARAAGDAAAATPTLDAVAEIYSAWLKGLTCKTAPRS
jgi:hypothetical protein